MMKTIFTLPRPAGKHPVGLWHTVFHCAAEPEVPLTLTVYYPAADAAGPPAPYAFPQVLEPWGLEGLDTGCALEAVPAAGPFPLIVYSHGYLTFAMSNTVLCGDLASNGYVVAAIGHTGEATVQLPDGRVIPPAQTYVDYVYGQPMFDQAGEILAEVAALADSPENDGRLLELTRRFHAIHDGNLNDRAPVWQQRTAAAVEHLRALNSRPGSLLADTMDFAPGVGLTGHSFGGITAANCCAEDTLFPCGINIDGAQIGGSFGRDIGKPFLSISGGDGRILRDLYRRNTADAYQVNIKGVEHMGFTDKGMLGGLTGQALAGVGTKDPEAVRRLLCDLHLQFFDRYILGRPTELHAPGDSDVTMLAKAGRKGGKEKC